MIFLPIITGKPGNIPFPSRWKGGGGGKKKKKKLGRILQRWKFASHRQQGGHFSPVMCAILYKIIYDSRERERERVFLAIVVKQFAR